MNKILNEKRKEHYIRRKKKKKRKTKIKEYAILLNLTKEQQAIKLEIIYLYTYKDTF